MGRDLVVYLTRFLFCFEYHLWQVRLQLRFTPSADNISLAVDGVSLILPVVCYSVSVSLGAGGFRLVTVFA